MEIGDGGEPASGPVEASFLSGSRIAKTEVPSQWEGGRHPGTSLGVRIKTQALDDRLSEPYGVRTEGGIRLTACHPNRVQANCQRAR
jgi:hypothetical protein